ncbi:hypothetical protein SGLAM104S_02433 [Streptomyces glaucescens]
MGTARRGKEDTAPVGTPSPGVGDVSLIAVIHRPKRSFAFREIFFA